MPAANSKPAARFITRRRPSFWVSPDKQFYHCFGCGAHGTVIGFLMQYEKMEFLDAVAELAQRAGLELPREAKQEREPGSADLHDLMTRAARFFEQNLVRQPARAATMLKQRGIDAANRRAVQPGLRPRLPGSAAQPLWNSTKTSGAGCCRSA